MTTKLLANQLHSILNDPVEGFTVELVDEANLYEWRVYIEGPKDTCYSGGVFQLSLNFPKDYPMSPPVLKFVSDFWHPNVFRDGKVCMSILHPPGEDAMSGELPEERWLPTQSVTTIILSLLSLLDDPNFASPANVDASVEWRKHNDTFRERCAKLVEKANKECPSHVVIPHPESDATQHKRRVEKMREMNKELDYDDFYDDAEDDAEEEDNNESGDEEEFLESENEMSEGESKKEAKQKASEKLEAASKSEKVEQEKGKEKEKEIDIEVKTNIAEVPKKDKGKTKVEEQGNIITNNSASNNNNNSNSSTNREASGSSVTSPSLSQNNNNNNNNGSIAESSSTSRRKKKGKKTERTGKKKDGKCLIM